MGRFDWITPHRGLRRAAPGLTQVELLVGVAIMVPLILGYTGWSYWVFRGKVNPESGYH